MATSRMPTATAKPISDSRPMPESIIEPKVAARIRPAEATVGPACSTARAAASWGRGAVDDLLAQPGGQQDVVVGAHGHHEHVADHRHHEHEPLAPPTDALEGDHRGPERGREPEPHAGQQVERGDDAPQQDDEDRRGSATAATGKIDLVVRRPRLCAVGEGHRLAAHQHLLAGPGHGVGRVSELADHVQRRRCCCGGSARLTLMRAVVAGLVQHRRRHRAHAARPAARAGRDPREARPSDRGLAEVTYTCVGLSAPAGNELRAAWWLLHEGASEGMEAGDAVLGGHEERRATATATSSPPDSRARRPDGGAICSAKPFQTRLLGGGLPAASRARRPWARSASSSAGSG